MSPVVFFDLEAIGFELAGWDGTRLLRFTPAAGLAAVVAELQPMAQLGVIAIDPDLAVAHLERALSATSVEAAFDTGLLIAGGPGVDPPFVRALRAAGLESTPDEALYVGPDPRHRSDARAAGLRVAPHARLAASVLAAETLHYARLSGPPPGQSWASLAQGRALVPLLLAQEPHSVLYAVAARSALDDLASVVGDIETMGTPDDVATTSLSLLQLRVDELAASQALRDFVDDLPRDAAFVRETPSGLVVAIPGSLTNEEFHPPDAGHGHTRAMMPRPSLLMPALMTGGFALRALESWEQAALAQLDAGLYGQLFRPCCGLEPLATPNGSVVITSRHIKHPNNADATRGFAMALAQICGAEHSHQLKFGSIDGKILYDVYAEIPGSSDELVVIGAHLDSTAAKTTDYPGNEASWAAPGADDDASGVAAVLAAAQVLKVMSEIAPPQRTIRFVLFNAEEKGMVGSQGYADWLKQSGAAVAAMLQMDMIGWVAGAYPSGIFEVHGTGTGDYANVAGASCELAQLVIGAAAQVAPGLIPQLYPIDDFFHDPASNRSDHGSFQGQGWPACLVIEDLWAEVAAVETPQTGNQAYHKQDDTSIHVGYAADVGRAVAAAAWMLARPSAWIAAPPPPPPDPIQPGTDELSPVPGNDVIAIPGPSPNSNEEGSTPMPTKYLVEFLAKWIRDKDFRCEVLHKESTTLINYGLNAAQQAALLSLNEDTIVEQIRAEFKALGVDLAQLKEEVGGGLIPIPLEPVDPEAPGGGDLLGGPGRLPTLVGNDAIRRAAFAALARRGDGSGRASVNPGSGGLPPIMLSTATTYTEGQTHIRGLDTNAMSVGETKSVTLRGQGFDANPEVRFELGDEHVEATVDSIGCDFDVYQRVHVTVKLDKPGEWKVRARNTGTTEPWSTEDVVMNVIGLS